MMYGQHSVRASFRPAKRMLGVDCFDPFDPGRLTLLRLAGETAARIEY
jgi:hypothetical protein